MCQLASFTETKYIRSLSDNALFVYETDILKYVSISFCIVVEDNGLWLIAILIFFHQDRCQLLKPLSKKI